MTSFVTAVAQEMDVAADALRGVAIMADAIDQAWRFDIEPLCVDRRCDATCSGKCRLNGLCHFVEPDDEDDFLRSPGDGSYTVAIAVYIHDDTVFGYGIGTGEIYVSSEGAEVRLLFFLWRLDRVAVDDIECASVFQQLRDAEIADCGCAAPCHGAAVGDEVGDFLGSLLASRAIEGFHVAAIEVLDHALSELLVSEF